MLSSNVQQSVLKKFNNMGKKNNKTKHLPLLPKFSKLPAKFLFRFLSPASPLPQRWWWGSWASPCLPLAHACAKPQPLPGRRGPTLGTRCWQRQGTAVDVDVDASVCPQLRSMWSNSFNRFTSLNGVSDRILLARSIAADAL